MWDLVALKEPGVPALGVWNLSHWTTREVPRYTSYIQCNKNLNSYLDHGRGAAWLVTRGMWYLSSQSRDQIHVPAPLPWSRVPWKRPWRGQLQSMPQGASLRASGALRPRRFPGLAARSFEQPWSSTLPWSSGVMFINHSITRAPVSHCCGGNRGSGGEEGASPDLRGSFLVTGQQGSEKHWASPGEYLTTCYESSHVPEKFTC